MPATAAHPGYPGYLAREDGAILNARSGREVSPFLEKGWPRVNVRDASGRKGLAYVAKFVLVAFRGDLGGRVAFLDGDPGNCALANLSWEEGTCEAEAPPGLRPVPGEDGYYAAPDGSIYSTRRFGDGRLRKMSPCRDGNGYLAVKIRGPGKNGRTRTVHTMVCETFRGPAPSPLHQVRHLDGARDNCSMRNLVWGLVEENVDDKFRHRTIVRGEDHRLAKLTEPAAVGVILAKGSMTAAEAAARFGITASYVNDIWRGEAWSHLPESPGYSRHLELAAAPQLRRGDRPKRPTKAGPERAPRGRLDAGRRAELLSAKGKMRPSAAAEEFGISQAYVRILWKSAA